MDSINFFKIAALPDSAYRLVKLSSTSGEVELTAGAEDQVVGVLLKRPISAGAKVQAMPNGPTKLIASGAIVAGEALVPAALGAVAGAAGNVEGNVVGFALQAASDGNDFWAILLPKNDAVLDYTVGAESGNAVAVTLSGLAAMGAKRYFAEALDPDGGESANYTLAETGDGAEVNTTGGPGLLFSLSSAGAAEITVTDGSGTATETMLLKLTPAGHPGPVLYIPITFA